MPAYGYSGVASASTVAKWRTDSAGSACSRPLRSTGGSASGSNHDPILGTLTPRGSRGSPSSRARMPATAASPYGSAAAITASWPKLDATKPSAPSAACRSFLLEPNASGTRRRAPSMPCRSNQAMALTLADLSRENQSAARRAASRLRIGGSAPWSAALPRRAVASGSATAAPKRVRITRRSSSPYGGTLPSHFARAFQRTPPARRRAARRACGPQCAGRPGRGTAAILHRPA